MKKAILLTVVGITLIMAGYILEIKDLDFGSFMEGFGAGILIVGIIQLIGSILKSKQSQQS